MINKILDRLEVLAGVKPEVEEARGISDDTWDGMNSSERKKYVKDHPTSRFAKDPKYGFGGVTKKPSKMSFATWSIENNVRDPSKECERVYSKDTEGRKMLVAVKLTDGSFLSIENSNPDNVLSKEEYESLKEKGETKRASKYLGHF